MDGMTTPALSSALRIAMFWVMAVWMICMNISLVNPRVVLNPAPIVPAVAYPTLPKTFPFFEEIMAAIAASSKEASMATSLLMVQVILRDPVTVCPVVSMVVWAGALMNDPENSTGTPFPYLVRTYGITTPRLSVVTVTFKKWERR